MDKLATLRRVEISHMFILTDCVDLDTEPTSWPHKLPACFYLPKLATVDAMLKIPPDTLYPKSICGFHMGYDAHQKYHLQSHYRHLEKQFAFCFHHLYPKISDSCLKKCMVLSYVFQVAGRHSHSCPHLGKLFQASLRPKSGGGSSRHFHRN